MLLLVSGWPACGKREFARWLEENRDFRHLDLAEPESFGGELLTLWESLDADSAPAFAKALLKRHPDWILTWGAPAGCIPRMEALRAAGFDGWFFLPGTEQRSRLEWLQRERANDPDIRPSAWDHIATEIRKGARDLRRFFRDRCIETLNSRGERLSNEELAERLGVPGASSKPQRGRAASRSAAPRSASDA